MKTDVKNTTLTAIVVLALASMALPFFVVSANAQTTPEQQPQDSTGNSFSTRINLSSTQGSAATMIVKATGMTSEGLNVEQEMVDEDTFNVTVEGTFAITAAVPEPEEPAPVPEEEEQGASIIVSPSSGQVGSLVIIEGTGFEPDQRITMTIDDIELEMTMATPLTTDETGDFPAIAATIPDIEPDEYEISVTDDSGNSAVTAFTVEGAVEVPEETAVASITSTPNVGPSGSEVTVDGTGFGARENITFAFDGNPLNASVTADNLGSFSATAMIPVDASSGDHEISASDISGNTATATFTVEAI